MDEARFLKLISTPTPSLDERVMRGLLRALSWGYGGIISQRNALFDRGIKRAHAVDVPVISIGNLTTGGTGKTPLAAFLCQWFAKRNVRVGIVSRGYRAIDAFNDEKRVLDRLCPLVPHVQNRDRVAAVEQVRQESDIQLVLADDAFQHRRLKRDLDLVLIDALNPWGYGHLLPRGLLREPPSSLRRASAVILTRANQITAEQRQVLWDEVQHWRPGTIPIEVAFEATSLSRGVAPEGVSLPITADELRNERFLAFCAIGNPNAFEETLKQAGLNVVGFRRFPDHHHFSERDIESLTASAERAGATAFIATLKDVVKLPSGSLGNRPVWHLNIEAKVQRGAEELDRILGTCVAMTLPKS